MAGEPNTFIYLFKDGKLAKLEDLELAITMEEYNTIRKYLDDVSASNYDSAVSFTESLTEESIKDKKLYSEKDLEDLVIFMKEFYEVDDKVGDDDFNLDQYLDEKF